MPYGIYGIITRSLTANFPWERYNMWYEQVIILSLSYVYLTVKWWKLACDHRSNVKHVFPTSATVYTLTTVYTSTTVYKLLLLDGHRLSGVNIRCNYVHRHSHMMLC